MISVCLLQYFGITVTVVGAILTYHSSLPSTLLFPRGSTSVIALPLCLGSSSDMVIRDSDMVMYHTCKNIMNN